ncbi:MAG TPA: universal stress protein [Anaerovoracaceae bacterium]|nr:universal stress protein [Anaerovoracaceae bacterium]
MKILVPVDGSLASFNAAKKSAEIAKRHDAVVLLVTVIDSGIARQYRNEKLWRQVDGSIISGNARTVDNEELDAEIRQNATELLDSLEEDLDFGDAKIEKFVLTGEPYHLILDTAKGVNADLIVMGNRGFSKIKRFFTGSVTQRVISEAPCPVLVIHTDAED